MLPEDKESNFKDSIISAVVVVAILIGAVIFIVTQSSEVDDSKKELEKLRLEVEISEFELAKSKEQWDLQVIEDIQTSSEQEEELTAAQEEFDAQKEEYEVRYQAELKKELEARSTEVTETKPVPEKESVQDKAAEKNLKKSIQKLEYKNKALKNEVNEYRAWKLKREKLNRAAARTAEKEKATAKATAAKEKSVEEKEKAQDEVLKLMNEFSQLGVNLKSPDWCDAEYTQKYFKAESKLEDIKGLVSHFGLGDSYKAYILQNSKSSANSPADGWCNGVKLY